MAKTISEIMNAELFFLQPGELVGDALAFLVTMGMSGAPVLDPFGKPLGVVSLADLAGRDADTAVEQWMTSPPMCIGKGSAIEEAGRLMGEAAYHRLIAIDSEGRAVGIVTTLDVVRGLLGMPAPHPLAHYDAATGLEWSPPLPLELDRIEAAPAARGLFVVVQSEQGEPDQVVWAEGALDVRARLVELLTAPEGLLPHGVSLHFRTSLVEGPVGLEQALAVLARQGQGRDGN